MAQNVGDGAGVWEELLRKGTLGSGSGMQVRFRVPITTTKFVLGLQVDDGTSNPPRLALYGDGTGKLLVQYNDGLGWRYPVALTPTVNANTWYTLSIMIDDTRGPTLELYEAATVNARLTYNLGLPKGKQWRFHAWTWSGTVYLDNYREFTGTTTYTPNDWQGFTYDALDRLTSVYTYSVISGYTATYSYDAIGNILTKSEGPTSLQTFNFGAQQGGCSGGALTKTHAPRDFVVNGNTNPLCYDANGNMTQRVEMSGTQGIMYPQQWDKENRLTVVTNTATSPAFITTFYYNGDGARVKKTEQYTNTGVITTTLYVGALEIISATQRVTRTQYMAGGQLIAVREMTTTTGAGTLTYLHSDHLGSTSLTTNASGAVVSRQSYYPYGGVRQSGNLPTSHTYTGQISDGAGTGGLMYYNARFYSPGLARFASADTIVPGAGEPQNLNRYAYVSGNPLKHTDPTGHCPTCLGGFFIGAAFGAAVYAATTLTSGRDFNPIDLGIAAATGAIGGTLIGSGIGAGAGIGMFAAIGAGGGVLAAEGGYALSSGTEYNSNEMLVAATVGGVAGAISGAAGAPAGVNPISNAAVATGVRLATSATASAIQYAGTELVNGRTPKWEVASTQAAFGLAFGGLDEALGSNYTGRLIQKFGADNVLRNPVFRNRFFGSLLFDNLADFARSASVEALTNPLNDLISDEVDDLVPSQ